MAKTARLDARDSLLYRPRERKPKAPEPPIEEEPYVVNALAKNGTLKTAAMLKVEIKLEMPIEQALEGSLSEIAERTGMDFTTASKWRKRLGLSR